MSKDEKFNPATRQHYLELIQLAAAHIRETYNARLEAWRLKFDPDSILARDFPSFIFTSATFEAFLFDVSGDMDCAHQAKKALLQLREIEEWFPTAFGPSRNQDKYGFWKRVPQVPPEAYSYLKKHGILSADETKLIEGWLADYAESFFNFHEWGAHNRALWTTRDFARIITLLPRHPATPRWKKLCRHLLDSSWGKWSIEDAQIYLPLWLSKMMHIADILELPNLFREYNMLYYLNYFLHLMAPHGMVTDYGDARWQECWHWYLTCFERGAKEYKNEEFKWAASRIFETKAKHAKPDEIDIDFPFLYECCGDSVGIRKPVSGSRMVMDDLAGKKIVFRNGWEPDSSFLMLNYKGDQDYGRCDRDYLRQTINVPAEKMHHGHADENAICLLMSRGSVLLNDAGYRETLTNGMYRADFYHNRLVFRNEPPDRSEPLLNSLHKRSWYQPTHTERIHFFNFDRWDYSRTRVKRSEEKWEWDRSIIYLKAEDMFVLIDSVRILDDTFLNINSLFHTEQLLNFGPNWFDSRLNEIMGWRNPGDRRLLIWFKPQVGMNISSEQLLRNRMVNYTVYQSLFREFKRNEIVHFCTLLIPHDKGADLEKLVARISDLQPSLNTKGVGLIIDFDGYRHIICLKLDLELDLVEDEIRPKYRYERGEISFGDQLLATDARLLLIRQTENRLRYGFAEASKIKFRNQMIYQAPSTQPSIFHPNGEFFRIAQPKRDWWEDDVQV
ncbi:hypothetical protein JXJ21_10520 [candidate division KSB1 bacterium]|nr:hypothetical protein [candidate division KSB1 bacterium]